MYFATKSISNIGLTEILLLIENLNFMQQFVNLVWIWYPKAVGYEKEG